MSNRFSLLVVYTWPKAMCRNSLKNNLLCYRRYLKDADVYYYNYSFQNDKILNVIKKIPFDFVLFDRTFFYAKDESSDIWSGICDGFSRTNGRWKNTVIAIAPQDEYRRVDRIRQFVNEINVDIIFTVADFKARKKLYPKKECRYKKIYTIFTGYVENQDVSFAEKIFKEHKNRKYDIGYRARKPSYALGSMGILKHRITEEFSAFANKYYARVNIGNTEGRGKKDVFLGDDWLSFLMECRVVPGCMGGASILDFDGKLTLKVDSYTRKNPKASFKEVASLFLKEYEGNIDYRAISPRLFEAAMTKTCQVLIKADYKIVEPGIDYIELEEDFSNIEEVFDKILDIPYCEQIAENAYKHLITSGKYTYGLFTKKVLNAFIKLKQDKTHKVFCRKGLKVFLYIYNKYTFV